MYGVLFTFFLVCDRTEQRFEVGRLCLNGCFNRMATNFPMSQRFRKESDYGLVSVRISSSLLIRKCSVISFFTQNHATNSDFRSTAYLLDGIDFPDKSQIIVKVKNLIHSGSVIANG